ncbi:MAG: DUF4279 domain-containing protein [Elusimicrobia bacterium]|nr:DUF4279 domain-containing protein [Elusimicrobiota bacterium]
MAKVEISIRINHPEWPAEKISKLLNEEPELSRTVGEPRTTPMGDPLKGVNRETHWLTTLDYRGNSVTEAIKFSTNRYAQFKGVFQEIRITGGDVEFFIGWFLKKRGGDGEVIPADVLKRVGELGVSLSFDIYGPETRTDP